MRPEEDFQKNLLNAMLANEEVYFALARGDADKGHNTAVICDRGAMDASTCKARACPWRDEQGVLTRSRQTLNALPGKRCYRPWRSTRVP